MRVVIVGGGLSGLSLAAFLRRVNIDAVVLEQHANLTERYVPPYVLYANALSCYKSYDLDSFFAGQPLFYPETLFGVMNHRRAWLLKLRNRDVHLRPLHSADALPTTSAPVANSNSVVSQRLTENLLAELGHVPLRLTIPSVTLLEELRRHVVEIKFGCRVVDIIPYEGIKEGVQVCMQDGRTEYGDVVVGADGMGSTVRRILYPCEQIGVSDAKLGIFRVDGYVNHAEMPDGVVGSVEMWGAQRSLALTPPIAHLDTPLAFSAIVYKPATTLAPACDTDVLQITRKALSSEFSDYGADVTKLLRGASYAVLTNALEVPIMPRWFNRRAVLIGDAAHAALPSFLQQDASLCVEDAAILATALLDVPFLRDSGVEYAFHQYESVRRARVERYVRQARRARRFASMAHSQVRNALLRAVPSGLVGLSQQWLANWTFSAQQTQTDLRVISELMFR